MEFTAGPGEQADWYLFEVVFGSDSVQHNGLTVTFDSPSAAEDPSKTEAQPLQVCTIHWVGRHGQASWYQMEPGTSPVGVSLGGESAFVNVSQPVGGSWNLALASIVEDVEPGHPTPVLVGAARYGGGEGTERSLEYQLRTETEVSWRLVDQGPLTCVRAPEDFHGGQAVTAAGAQVVEGMRFPLEAQRSGLLTTFYGTNDRLRLSLHDAIREAWSLERTADGPREPYGNITVVAPLAPGTWELRADEMRGTQTYMAASFLDLPSWAVEGITGCHEQAPSVRVTCLAP